jgi:hypothetical protein
MDRDSFTCFFCGQTRDVRYTQGEEYLKKCNVLNNACIDCINEPHRARQCNPLVDPNANEEIRSAASKLEDARYEYLTALKRFQPKELDFSDR